MFKKLIFILLLISAIGKKLFKFMFLCKVNVTCCYYVPKKLGTLIQIWFLGENVYFLV
jgi:hypothetical protein